MFFILFTLNNERTLKLCRYLNIVVAINTQDILNYITRTLHINAICRNLKHKSLFRFCKNLHVKPHTDILYHVMWNILSNQPCGIIVFQINFEVLHWLRIYIPYLHRNHCTSKFLCHYCSLLQCIYCSIRVNTTLKSERRISTEPMTTCALTNPRRMEISALQNDIHR